MVVVQGRCLRGEEVSVNGSEELGFVVKRVGIFGGTAKEKPSVNALVPSSSALSQMKMPHPVLDSNSGPAAPPPTAHPGRALSVLQTRSPPRSPASKTAPPGASMPLKKATSKKPALRASIGQSRGVGYVAMTEQDEEATTARSIEGGLRIGRSTSSIDSLILGSETSVSSAVTFSSSNFDQSIGKPAEKERSNRGRIIDALRRMDAQKRAAREIPAKAYSNPKDMSGVGILVQTQVDEPTKVDELASTVSPDEIANSNTMAKPKSSQIPTSTKSTRIDSRNQHPNSVTCRLPEKSLCDSKAVARIVGPAITRPAPWNSPAQSQKKSYSVNYGTFRSQVMYQLIQLHLATLKPPGYKKSVSIPLAAEMNKGLTPESRNINVPSEHPRGRFAGGSVWRRAYCSE